jgi:hypothetical protein
MSKPLPSLARIGQLVSVTGQVRGAPLGTRAMLELRRASGWRAVADASLRTRGAFTIRWRVGKRTAIGPVMLRVAAVHRGRVLAATRPAQSGVGPAPVYCAPPVLPGVDIPVGDGWIAGGRYNEGGAYPGISACDSQPYTIAATNAAGKVVAIQNVEGGDSYTLVVPAGSYKLGSNFCFGSATVRAGKQTKADTVCPVP